MSATPLHVGRELVSAGLTITEAHVVTWAGLTGDWVALHMDAELAARSVFGERVAHGPLTLAMALGLVTRLGVFDGQVLAWLGLDDVRASAPVRFGDTIRAHVTVAARRPSSRAGRDVCRLDYRVLNQRDQEVMTFVNSLLVAGAPVEVAP